jgi:hypothetical protein
MYVIGSQGAVLFTVVRLASSRLGSEGDCVTKLCSVECGFWSLNVGGFRGNYSLYEPRLIEGMN